MQQDDFKVTITWTWRDIETLHPDWSEDECKSYLMKVSKYCPSNGFLKLKEVGWVILEEATNES